MFIACTSDPPFTDYSAKNNQHPSLKLKWSTQTCLRAYKSRKKCLDLRINWKDSLEQFISASEHHVPFVSCSEHLSRAHIMTILVGVHPSARIWLSSQDSYARLSNCVTKEMWCTILMNGHSLIPHRGWTRPWSHSHNMNGLTFNQMYVCMYVSIVFIYLFSLQYSWPLCLPMNSISKSRFFLLGCIILPAESQSYRHCVY